ncbi:aldehyde dehydrogenase family protein [Halomonas sp. PR-M31]|uniref:aldehyde dehydrogenase family protein n=1 Tax=Halomonas sp. PR-M31 TaxID=1471202 RepID=UPI000A8DDBA1|nr:aldehyde dehydrogenase family protein [Halomonas sp. PR-M31]
MVGIIGTWNAPVFTLLSPLACVLGAGNRAILKPSEIAPRTAEVLANAFAERIDPDIIDVVTGDAEVGAAFAAQAFDHLVFTGSTQVGRKIMAAAAENLVPVTLELGGKSPTILGRSADLDAATHRIALAKSTNGGQICISPDLLYVPRERLEEALTGLKQAFASLYPSVAENPDVVSVINDAHLTRIEGYIDEVRQAGGRIEITPEDTTEDESSRRRALHLIVDPPRSSRILQEEIFGPALVVLPYDRIDEVIADINHRSRPLALYYFGEDAAEQRQVLEHTLSGGVTINDALMHAAMHEAPFGGVGASGMGHYHGFDGFREFSHMRTVFKAPSIDPRAEWGVLPPYDDGFLAAMKAQVVPD